MHQWRVVGVGLLQRHGSRQRFVINLNKLGRILGNVRILGYDYCNMLTDKSDDPLR
jgi:hypothetical protein